MAKETEAEKISRLEEENQELKSDLAEAGESIRQGNSKTVEKNQRIKELEKNLKGRESDIGKLAKTIEKLKKTSVEDNKEKARVEGKLEGYQKTYKLLVENLHPKPVNLDD